MCTQRGARVLVLVVAAVSGVVTLAAALFPELEVIRRLPALHVSFETAGALIALLAALLIVGRFLRRERVTELTLVCSLGVLAVSELAFATVPVGSGHGSLDLSVWAALGGRVIGAVLFALAVFLPDRRLRRPGFALGGGAVLVAVTPLLIAGAAVSFAPGLPAVSVSATGLTVPAGSGPSAGTILLRSDLAVMMIYGLAAAGFLRRAERSGDEFSGWLAAAAVLAGFSHLNYLLYPGIHGQLVSLGDVFRLGSYVVLLAGSAREISSYWQALPEVAALQERRRIARDLQDGLTGELAYLLRNLDTLDGSVETETGAQLRQAAERAQLAARMAISRLAPAGSEAVNDTIAGPVAGRRWLPRFRPIGPHLAGVRWRSRGVEPVTNLPDGELLPAARLRSGAVGPGPVGGDGERGGNVGRRAERSDPLVQRFRLEVPGARAHHRDRPQVLPLQVQPPLHRLLAG